MDSLVKLSVSTSNISEKINNMNYDNKCCIFTLKPATGHHYKEMEVNYIGDIRGSYHQKAAYKKGNLGVWIYTPEHYFLSCSNGATLRVTVNSLIMSRGHVNRGYLDNHALIQLVTAHGKIFYALIRRGRIAEIAKKAYIFRR